MKTGITATVRVRALLAVVVAVTANVALGSDDFGPVERHAAKETTSGTVPSLALAITKDGKIVYERAFGYADLQQHHATTIHTAYPLASASKPITATALMALSEQGHADLDAPVENYIAPLRFRASDGRGNAVTLRHLLSHTSGLGTYARIAYGDDIASAPSGSTPYTCTRGFARRNAVETPAASPPPPIATITASRSGVCVAHS